MIEERYIGLEGTGNEIEYKVIHETDKAYKLDDGYGGQFWMPKAAFTDDGSVKPSFYRMLEENIAKAQVNGESK